MPAEVKTIISAVDKAKADLDRYVYDSCLWCASVFLTDRGTLCHGVSFPSSACPLLVLWKGTLQRSLYLKE